MVHKKLCGEAFKLMFQQYSGKENVDFELGIDRVIWDLINLIKRKYLSDGSTLRPLDFAHVIQYFTLDVITSLSLSHPFGYLAQDSDVYEYIKTMEDNFPIMFFMSSVPILSRILQIPWVQKATFPTVKDRTGMGKIKG